MAEWFVWTTEQVDERARRLAARLPKRLQALVTAMIPFLSACPTTNTQAFHSAADKGPALLRQRAVLLAITAASTIGRGLPDGNAFDRAILRQFITSLSDELIPPPLRPAADQQSGLPFDEHRSEEERADYVAHVSPPESSTLYDYWASVVARDGVLSLPHGSDYYLTTDHWELLKAALLTGCCVDCQRTTRTTLHHLNQDAFGQETAADVVELCARCHARRHGAGLWKKAA